MSNYDDWKTATPPYLEGEESIANAVIEMENANEKWLRDNYEKIRTLREDWHVAMVDAWEGETRAEFDDEAIPYNDIDAAYDAAGMLVARHDKAMRDGLHLGRVS
jgi:hypothetical protein